MTQESDATLVRTAQAGDRQALAMLLDRHWPLLISLCRRALGDPLWADDAAQEAAMQALLSLDRLRQPERFGPWLAGIGLNICRRWQRHRTGAAWSWDALHGGLAAGEALDPRADPVLVAEAADLRARVQRAVADLPPGQRTAVVLFYLEGLTYAETAVLLGVEVGAVKTRLHKARRSLRQRLWAVWKEEQMSVDAPTAWVEMQVIDVRRRPVAEGDPRWTSLVLLEEVGGARRLPIWIGPYEAEAIVMQLEQIPAPRPLTYVLMANLLPALGGRVREVRITSLVGEVFLAEVMVDGAAGRQAVDARPSDALNLALRVGAPVHVAASILDDDKAVRRIAGAEWQQSWYGAGTQGREEIAAVLANVTAPPRAGAPPPPPGEEQP